MCVQPCSELRLVASQKSGDMSAVGPKQRLGDSAIRRCQGRSRHPVNRPKATRLTQCMVRPCGARRFRRSGRCGLASMYPASAWSTVLRAIMVISTHVIWLADRPRPGHLGHQGSHAPGRPILHRRLILSQTSAGKGVVTSSIAPHLRAQTRRARGRQGRPSCCPDVMFCCRQAAPWRPRARREDQAGRDAVSSVVTHSKARPLLRTAQAIRASLLASAIASTLWCNRFLAALIQESRP